MNVQVPDSVPVDVVQAIISQAFNDRSRSNLYAPGSPEMKTLADDVAAHLGQDPGLVKSVLDQVNNGLYNGIGSPAVPASAETYESPGSMVASSPLERMDAPDFALDPKPKPQIQPGYLDPATVGQSTQPRATTPPVPFSPFTTTNAGSTSVAPAGNATPLPLPATTAPTPQAKTSFWKSETGKVITTAALGAVVVLLVNRTAKKVLKD